jgi:peptidyl-prolyl cis-trans isomerase C
MLARCASLILLLVLGCGTPPTPADAPPPSPTTSSAASSCGAGDDGSPAVVRAGDVLVSKTELKAAIQRLPARARARYADLAPQRMLAQRLAEERLLCRAAEEAALDAQAVARRAAEEAVAALYVDQAETAAVTDEAIQSFYESNANRYALEVVDAAHIVLGQKEDADRLLRELRAGADFANLAIGHSQDKRSGPVGGAVGWISRGRMDEAWTDAAFALEPGVVSEPVKTPYGWHLIKVASKRSTQPLEEVRPGIERRLRQAAAEATLAAVLGSVEIQLVGELLDGDEAGPSDPTP